MKKLLVVFGFSCALLCATDQAATASKKQRAAHAAPATNAKPAGKTEPAATIPKGATEVEPYLYRYTDTDGKKWLYRQTPFGVVKMEDKPAARVIVDNSNPVAVTDQGDTVKFEKKTPFGMQTWTRKKTDLTEDEKSMVQDSLKTAEKQ